MAFINSENASELAKKGNAIRWEAFHRSKANPTVANASQQNQASGEAIPNDDYRRQRLARVRKQLDRVDKMMLNEDDPARLDRLASAQARLSEQERILDGRPTPGQLRPGSKDDKRRRQPSTQSLPEPDDTPQHVVPPPNPPAGVNGNGA